MSVINNVLKDLENKSSAFTPLELTDVPNSKMTRRLQNRILFSGLLFTIATLIIFYYLNGSEINVTEDNNTLTETIGFVSDHEQLKVSPEQSVLSPLSEGVIEEVKSEVTGLQLNESEDFLELTLQLPLGAQSFLKHSSQNRYVFLISNATKTIISPDINDNLWLNSILINETTAGLEIKFHTRDDVLVETHHFEKAGRYYWNIRLKKSKPVGISAVSPQQNKIQVQPLKENFIEPPSVAISIDSAEKIVEKNEIQNVQHENFKLEITPTSVVVSDAELLHKAQLAMQQKDWLSAQNQLESLFNSSVDKKARVKLLNIFKLLKKTTDLKLLMAKSLKLYPDDIDLFIVDAGMLFSEKKYLTLIKRYQSKLDNMSIVNLVAASFQGINQHEKAIDYFQRSLNIDPRQPRKWISLAISQEQISQFQRASQSYRMALVSGDLNNKLQSFIDKRLQQLNNYTN